MYVFIPRNFNRGIGSLFDPCVNAMGRWPYCQSRMEVSHYLRIWRDHHTLSLLREYRVKTTRGFSCDFISSQFCKSSYSRPPCWFPLYMERYRKIQQNFLFSSYHNTKLQQNDKNISTHTLLEFQVFLWSKLKVQAFFVVFLYTTSYKKSCAYGCVPRRANPLPCPLYSKRRKIKVLSLVDINNNTLRVFTKVRSQSENKKLSWSVWMCLIGFSNYVHMLLISNVQTPKCFPLSRHGIPSSARKFK